MTTGTVEPVRTQEGNGGTAPGQVEPTTTQPPTTGTTSRNGQAAVSLSRPTRRRGRGRRLLLWGIAILVVLGIVGWAAATRMTAPPPPVTVATPQTLTAHGVVEPIARASIATMNGGVVDQLPVQVGQTVEAQQLVAQVDLGSQAEELVAPWRGTVTGINVHLGDTILAGTVVVTIGDLSRYQVETTDVDEYLIGHIRAGQAVMMTVEALDQVQLRGSVRSVALQQQSTAGVSNYPVVIDLAGPNAKLRPSMTVRITFAEPSS